MSKAGKPKHGLIVVSAPSGAGKSTLCAQLLKELSGRLSLSISSTSRTPRGTEQHGKEYFFVTKDKMMEAVNNKEFAEWALVHGNYYGTMKSTLNDFWSKGRHVLLDIDVQGMDSLRSQYPERSFTVFIAPPSMEVLEQRLRGRDTDSEDAIKKRMSNARDEMKRKDDFDLVIVNDSYPEAYAEFKDACTDFMDQMESGQWQKP